MLNTHLLSGVLRSKSLTHTGWCLGYWAPRTHRGFCSVRVGGSGMYKEGP